MSVYVDALMKWGGSATFRWTHSCHMYADTLEELHAFAQSIGMKRAWFQNHAFLPHYDLNTSRRKVAVTRGAVEHDRNQMCQWVMDRRAWRLSQRANAEEPQPAKDSPVEPQQQRT